MLGPQPDPTLPPTYAAQPRFFFVQVGVAAAPDDAQLRMVRGQWTTHLSGAKTGERPRARDTEMVRTNSRGVAVPVEHAFYDPEQDGHWW